MIGRIHSIESMGLVDGPGVRTVIFFQGCNLRCLYCHNPDTWSINSGTEVSSDDLMTRILRYKPYYKNGGGVTFSGGEPLLQPEFLKEMLIKCKQNNIHTCLDTAGYGNYKEVLELVDLVILDIKNSSCEGYLSLTGKDDNGLKEFLKNVKNKLWIRHVVVPGLTDSKEHMEELSKMIKPLNVEKIEFLPYHTMGIDKYKKMNMQYRLEDTPAMDKKKTQELYQYLMSLLK